jgi:hypothetical protein
LLYEELHKTIFILENFYLNSIFTFKMKKIISGMLICASLFGAMGSFTSCKDNDDDQYAVLQRDNVELMQQIKDLKKLLEDAKTQYATDLEQAKADLRNEIANGYVTNATYQALVKRVEELESKICACGDLTEKLNTLQANIYQWVLDKGYVTADDLKDYIKKDVLDGYATLDDLKTLESKLSNYLTLSDLTGYATTEDLKEYIKKSDLDGYLTTDDLAGYVKSTDLDGYLKKDGLDSAIAALIGDNTSATYQLIQSMITTAVNSAAYDDTATKAQLAALQKALESLGYVFTTDSNGNITITAPTGLNSSTDLSNALAQATWVSTNKEAIEKLLQTLGDLDPSTLVTKQGADTTYLSQTDAANTYLTKEDFEAYKNSLTDDLAKFVSIYNEVAGPLNMTADFTDLNSLLSDWIQWRADITTKVANNAAAISALQSKYDVLNTRLDAMITSMTSEGTWNPVFGSFSLPASITSNVVMVYHGNMNGVTFPAASSLYEFDGEQVFTSADIKMLGVAQQRYSGTVLPGEDDNYVGNAGVVYLTVNPGNVDMTGKTFTLTNSRGEASGMKLETPVKSDKLLTFGYSPGRAAEDVALYEANATLTPDGISNCLIEVESGLKSATLDVFKKRNIQSMATLLNLVYDQINGILPRLAVKAEWTYTTSKWNDTSAAWVDETNNGIVRTGLDIAATTFKPLSFKTLEGKGFSRKLPILSEISIDLNDLIDIDFSSLKVDSIDFSNVVIDFQMSEVDLSNVDATIPVKIHTTITIEGNEYPFEYDGNVSAADFVEQIAAAFNTTIKNSNEAITNEFKKIMQDLQDKVNSAINSISTSITDTVDKLVADIKNQLDSSTGKVFDRINSVINRYNSLATRINTIFANPNHYMQVTMLYKNSNGGFSFLSSNENYPSNFTLNGGNSLLLFPTTYNLDIVSPSFKKFVGICDAVNLATGKSAQEGDADAIAAVKKANDAIYFDKVIEGRNIRVNTGALTAGFKYTVAYSALDFRGFTSSNKYYFQVK